MFPAMCQASVRSSMIPPSLHPATSIGTETRARTRSRVEIFISAPAGKVGSPVMQPQIDVADRVRKIPADICTLRHIVGVAMDFMSIPKHLKQITRLALSVAGTHHFMSCGSDCSNVKQLPIEILHTRQHYERNRFALISPQHPSANQKGAHWCTGTDSLSGC